MLGFLKDKVQSKIRSWDGKIMARSGKEILVKSVVQTLPSYAMSVFLLPLEITRDIEKSLSKFWWTSKPTNSSHISWMSWERMSKHKTAGGLGFRNFRDFNLAMLGKQGWRFITNPESLVTKIYKAKYFSGGDFLTSSLGHNPSFIWRSIHAAKQLLLEGVKWRIGNGESIYISGQPWLHDNTNQFFTTESPAIENQKVSSLFKLDEKEWDVEIIEDIFNDRDQRQILAIQLNKQVMKM
ncbi:hypothetical protein DCAR_0831806 [Daucus carota subsp. sativus]|uniref:Reverse transcriptase zinc-binding domain-containing protein n=1 Tax=Daucus carota subsp. sativus TaxID=79200 RepID=A0AAF1BAD3_DAUCS|nr:hypothetical protein DCAR_0831806 [Daucus carota subsp. sativus]